MQSLSGDDRGSMSSPVMETKGSVCKESTSAARQYKYLFHLLPAPSLVLKYFLNRLSLVIQILIWNKLKPNSSVLLQRKI